VYNYGKTKKLKKTRKLRSANDHGEFQQQNTQATVLQYYRMDNRNERWMMRLKAIQGEYYFIEN
jgi:hypothetical protein